MTMKIENFSIVKVNHKNIKHKINLKMTNDQKFKNIKLRRSKFEKNYKTFPYLNRTNGAFIKKAVWRLC